MNLFLLYLLLLKATVLSFSGLASLPVVHHDFVVQHKVLSDRQLSAAVAAARVGPGPNGLYLVCVGYFVAGVPGATAGFLAMITPAFLVIPMLRYLGRRADRPQVQRVIRAVILGAAGLLIAATAPLARDAITSWPTAAVAVASFFVLTLTQVDTFWVIVAAAGAGLVSHWVR